MDEAAKQKIIWRAVMEEMAIHELQEWLHRRTGLPDYESPYLERRINTPICCPSCFNPVQISYEQCPDCGLALDICMMETLRDNAFELAAFAWNYRNEYEKDIVEGKIYQGEAAIKYCLHPPEGWLIYLASIVFTAILGGLSYDSFKKLLSKINNSFHARFGKEIPRGKWPYNFFSKLSKHVSNKRNRNSPVFRAYIEGLVKGSALRAEFERSPGFERNLIKSVQSIMSNVESENSELELQLPSEPPPEAEIRKHLEELLKKHTEMALAVNQLREYLSSLSELE